VGSASLSFLTFAAATVVLYNVNDSPLWRRTILMVANFVFLASLIRKPLAAVPLLGFLAIGFLLLRAVQGGRLRGIVLPVLAVITLFAWIKQYAFLPANIFLPFSYSTIGLSYIFFRVVHLIVDARSGNLPSPIGLVSYLDYTLNFATLVSGPIQRYQEVNSPPLPLSRADAAAAFERIVVGFFKASVLSMALASLQRREIYAISAGGPMPHPVLSGIAVVATYPFFLYCNFSGYIDVVIGIARLLGQRLPENFDRPFSADNFLNFWSRWHITLSQWLKIYVYNPMLMFLMTHVRFPGVEPFLGVVAFFITFSLVGLWHGQTSEFIFFGILQGLGVSINKLYQVVLTQAMGRKKSKALMSNPVYTAFTRGLTFTWFGFTLVWFWSNWHEIGELSRALGKSSLISVWIAIWTGATVLLAAWEWLRAWALSERWQDRPMLESPYFRTVWDTALVTVSAAISILLRAPAPEIVYKGF
jgi:alginate O-acetyltransferase complex protein AlgI